jgi:DNA-binding NarL/FixJ family response regulator
VNRKKKLSIRILLADDHRMFRQGLRRLLEDQPDMVVVAEAASFGEAEKLLDQHAIDLAIVDLSMPGSEGAQFIGRCKQRHSDLPLLVISMHGENPYVTRALRAGADGYVTKEHAAEVLIEAARKVAQGGRYLCSSVAETLARAVATSDDSEPPHMRLTVREYRVFELLVNGRRGSEIAVELSVSEKTVSSHKANVLQKMSMQNQTQLVLYASKHGLLPVR